MSYDVGPFEMRDVGLPGGMVERLVGSTILHPGPSGLTEQCLFVPVE